MTAPTKPIRCAIYTRKSTEEGLDLAFNTLHAQRESAEAYITSRKGEGWTCLPEHYDDGGFTGGNMERPALNRLLNDIASGGIDTVVVYKVDRLSRSLLDFARIMSIFDQHGVAFVSVTQSFSTADSMGRLMLNVLLSFAQFEREVIAERTRDKIRAAKRKGKYAGGRPVLGYDVASSPAGSRLVVNEAEARQVREIFALYAAKASLIQTVQELDRRAWHSKKWITRKGTVTGGTPFTKTSLHALLTNPTFIGKVPCNGELFDGEHEAIIPPEEFDEVQQMLKRNGANGGTSGGGRNRHEALLRGLLKCGNCGCAMCHTFTRKSKRLYRYYQCSTSQKRGREACSTGSISAGEIEQFVVDEIREVLANPAILEATLTEARSKAKERTTQLTDDRGQLRSEKKGLHVRIRSAAASDRAQLCERLALVESQLEAIEQEMTAIRDADLSSSAIRGHLEKFDTLWTTLNTREKCRLIALLIESITYDAEAGSVRIAYRPEGFRGFRGFGTASKEIAA